METLQTILGKSTDAVGTLVRLVPELPASKIRESSCQKTPTCNLPYAILTPDDIHFRRAHHALVTHDHSLNHTGTFSPQKSLYDTSLFARRYREFHDAVLSCYPSYNQKDLAR